MTTPPLSAEQQALSRLIEDTREHVFVTGRAGTGKSTLLQHLAWNTKPPRRGRRRETKPGRSTAGS